MFSPPSAAKAVKIPRACLCKKGVFNKDIEFGRYMDGTAMVEQDEEKAANFEAKMRRKAEARNQIVTLIEYSNSQVEFWKAGSPPTITQSEEAMQVRSSTFLEHRLPHLPPTVCGFHSR